MSELELLKLLIAEKKYNTTEIANRLNKTVGQVRHMLRMNNLSSKITRSRTDNKVIYEHSQKWGIKQAAEHYGLTYSAILNIRRDHLKRINKPVTKKLSDELEASRKMCIKYAQKRHSSTEDSQDFAMWAVCKKLESGRDFANVSWQYKKWIKLKHQTRSKAESGNYDESPQLKDGPMKHVSSVESTADGFISFKNMLAQLPLRQRGIVFLHLYYGLTMEHCGFVYGIDRSTVNRLYAQSLSTLRNNIEE